MSVHRRNCAPASVDRRSFLKSVGDTAAAALVVRSGATILAPTVAMLQTTSAVAHTDNLLVQPSEIRSQNGFLTATLTAAPGRVQLGSFAFPGLFYNGSYLPPILRARLGDVMRITFRNELPDQRSNLHYHGMSVSPQGNSDNVFIHVHPGQQFRYGVPIPASGRQGPGLFWYHPHAHGVVHKQLEAGMSGGLVVEGSDQLFPILAGRPERFFLIKHQEIDENNEIASINGQINPIVQIQPGELQFFRIANISATMFARFRIEGMPLYVVATDGHPLSPTRKTSEFFLGPGQRIDAIAIGPDAGEYAMRTISFQNQAWNKAVPGTQLATIVSAGARASPTSVEAEILRQTLVGPAWIDQGARAPSSVVGCSCIRARLIGRRSTSMGAS